LNRKDERTWEEDPTSRIYRERIYEHEAVFVRGCRSVCLEVCRSDGRVIASLGGIGDRVVVVRGSLLRKTEMLVRVLLPAELVG
jgi:hypothetical protein